MNEAKWTVAYFDGERRTVQASGEADAKRKGHALRPGIWILQVFPAAVFTSPRYIFEGKGAP